MLERIAQLVQPYYQVEAGTDRIIIRRSLAYSQYSLTGAKMALWQAGIQCRDGWSNGSVVIVDLA